MIKSLLAVIIIFLLLVSGCSQLPVKTSSSSQTEKPATKETIPATTFSGSEPAPASFSLSNLSIRPAEAQAAEPVTITVDITNTGGAAGSYNVELMINGVKELDKDVAIAAGDTQTATFSITKKEAVSYDVVVGDLSGSFSVVALTPEPTPSSVEPETDQPFAWVSDITPGSGVGTPSSLVPSGDDGPWYHRIMSASSEDGLTWVKDDIIIADQASVPDAIIDKEGNIRIYYVDWYNDHGISVALSRDGMSWIYKATRIFGQDVQSGELAAPMDPDIVILPDGRYRLYYVYKGAICSAVSNYGIDFTNENGTRFSQKGHAWMDPDVCQMGDVWRMFIWGDGDIISVVSTDGLNFTKEYDLGKVGIQCTIPVEDGYRMYYPRDDGIFTAFTSDGINWVEEGMRLESAWDPAIIIKQDGTYTMFYKTWIPPATPPWLKS